MTIPGILSAGIMRNYLLCIMAIIMCCFNSKSAWSDDGLKIESFQLKNGMKVVYIPNHKVPAISHSVWYYAGAAEDPWGQSGAAHFLEHMMFRGSKEVAAGEFSKIISRNGGRDNAFTSYDMIAFFQLISSDKLPMVMKMEAERMNGLLLDEKQFQNEKKVILEERRQTMENNPTRMLVDAMANALYRNHPYGRPVIGFENEIESLTLQNLQAFYKRYYNPSNATLIVAGDVKRDELEKLADEYYGRLPAGEKSSRARNKILPLTASTDVVVKNKTAKQPLLINSYAAPAGRGDNARYGMPLIILSQILGGEYTGRLYNRLVKKDKLVSGVFSNYNDVSFDDTVFQIGATPLAVASIPKVQTAINEEIQMILKNGVTNEELARVKNSMIAQSVYEREGLFNLARAVGSLLTAGLDENYIINFSQNVDAVTVEQIKEAAEYVFKDKNSVSGTLIPAGDNNEKK